MFRFAFGSYFFGSSSVRLPPCLSRILPPFVFVAHLSRVPRGTFRLIFVTPVSFRVLNSLCDSRLLPCVGVIFRYSLVRISVIAREIWPASPYDGLVGERSPFQGRATRRMAHQKTTF